MLKAEDLSVQDAYDIQAIPFQWHIEGQSVICQSQYDKSVWQSYPNRDVLCIRAYTRTLNSE